MKSILTIIVILFTQITTYAQTEHIKFIEKTNWSELKSMSLKQKKIIFLDIYATWCTPCKKMENEVYSIDSIAKYVNEKLISVKVQIDSSKRDNNSTREMYEFAKEIVAKYRIKSVPTFLFLDENGHIIHREEGYLPPAKLMQSFLVANDPNKSLARQLTKFENGELIGKSLLSLALRLKSYHEDSLASKVALIYKQSAIDAYPPKQIITSELLPMIQNFFSLFSSKDSLIQYISKNRSYVDSAFNSEGLSNRIVKIIAYREMIKPQLMKDDEYLPINPSWDKLEGEIAKKWDYKTANELVLNAKIDWYTEHKKWDSVIKYQMEKIDKIDSRIEFFDAFNINNFVWYVVLKYSNDNHVLNKSKKYMERVLEVYPKDYSKIDTYANVLYKLGKKQEAIIYETKALTAAEEGKDSAQVTAMKETLNSMKSSTLTWDESK